MAGEQHHPGYLKEDRSSHLTQYYYFTQDVSQIIYMGVFSVNFVQRQSVAWNLLNMFRTPLNYLMLKI